MYAYHTIKYLLPYETVLIHKNYQVNCHFENATM